MYFIRPSVWFCRLFHVRNDLIRFAGPQLAHTHTHTATLPVQIPFTRSPFNDCGRSTERGFSIIFLSPPPPNRFFSTERTNDRSKQLRPCFSSLLDIIAGQNRPPDAVNETKTEIRKPFCPVVFVFAVRFGFRTKRPRKRRLVFHRARQEIAISVDEHTTV